MLCEYSLWVHIYKTSYELLTINIVKAGNTKGGGKYHCTIDLLFRSIFAKLPMNFLQSIFWMGCLIDKVKRPYQVNLASLRQGILKGGSTIVPLTSCLTGLAYAESQLTISVFICKTE
jgi:hypothetical protein